MNILITGAGGFIGQALAVALLEDPSITTITLTDIVEPPTPSMSATTNTKINCIKADLTDRAACEKLLTPELTNVYLLHGLMSGAAEANLDLGLRVNVDSTRIILDILRKVKPGIQVIFPSSLAVFGPSGEDVVTEATKPSPRSSYGAEKLICEILLDDFSRRGLIDGRIVRLPTIIVRPGAPSGAASSFCSGIIREPLKGEISELPVSKDLALWVCSTRTIIRNLVYAKSFGQENFKGGSRVVNLPGITVTVQEMLQALKDVGGDNALNLVQEKRNPDVEKIVNNWPSLFNTAKAKDLGFISDGSLQQAIQDYIEDYGNSSKV
ncbi:NAD dependent epimerase/dehydratase [Tricladium varicosporioides]|nr:NAD dependent epimerase/dehydratase [Hymenoscyphus varicosporioides]